VILTVNFEIFIVHLGHSFKTQNLLNIKKRFSFEVFNSRE